MVSLAVPCATALAQEPCPSVDFLLEAGEEKIQEWQIQEGLDYLDQAVAAFACDQPLTPALAARWLTAYAAGVQRAGQEDAAAAYLSGAAWALPESYDPDLWGRTLEETWGAVQTIPVDARFDFGTTRVPPDVELRIDGHPTPVDAELPAGTHLFQLVGPDGPIWALPVTLQGGQRIEIHRVPLPQPAMAPTASTTAPLSDEEAFELAQLAFAPIPFAPAIRSGHRAGIARTIAVLAPVSAGFVYAAGRGATTTPELVGLSLGGIYVGTVAANQVGLPTGGPSHSGFTVGVAPGMLFNPADTGVYGQAVGGAWATSLRTPVQIPVSEWARLRVMLDVTIGIGTDRLTWTTEVDQESVRFFEDGWAAQTGTTLLVGPDVIVPTHSGFGPYFGAYGGAGWFGVYHELLGASEILRDPDDDRGVEPYTNQLAWVAAVLAGVADDDAAVSPFAEVSMSVATLDAAPLRSAAPGLDGRRDTLHFNPVGVHLGVRASL